MPILSTLRNATKKILFAGTLIPQEFTIGLPDPQTEITVWLDGIGSPRDITSLHSTACSSPFAICIAFDRGNEPSEEDLEHASLRFCERAGQRRVLGKIGLKFSPTISPVSLLDSKLFFFEVKNSVNYCLPRLRLYAHYLLQEYSLRRGVNTSGMTMSLHERHAAIVTFIRPHPIALVSVADAHGGNIFTMNIMGDLGHGRFGFALKESRTAAHIVERVGRVALSTVPLPDAKFVFELAANHFKSSIQWNTLPFDTMQSGTFRIPVPAFASRVREMEVEEIRKIGSHNFFIAKIVSDEMYSKNAIVCAIHGLYQAWRLRGDADQLRISVAEDSFNKRGRYAA
jgi:flavin reductase (DIM6/NTAB) family NADH-FMN oxidoreductase RutF